MTDRDASTGPLAFAASFPPEERYAVTAADIAARLALTAGCGTEASEEIRGVVDAAFREALAEAAADGGGIDLTLRTVAGAFDADVACGRRAVLHCSRRCAA